MRRLHFLKKRNLRLTKKGQSRKKRARIVTRTKPKRLPSRYIQLSWHQSLIIKSPLSRHIRLSHHRSQAIKSLISSHIQLNWYQSLIIKSLLSRHIWLSHRRSLIIKSLLSRYIRLSQRRKRHVVERIFRCRNPRSCAGHSQRMGLWSVDLRQGCTGEIRLQLLQAWRLI